MAAAVRVPSVPSRIKGLRTESVPLLWPHLFSRVKHAGGQRTYRKESKIKKGPRASAWLTLGDRASVASTAASTVPATTTILTKSSTGQANARPGER